MTSPDVATWAQQTVPVDATAVFPPGSVPSGTVGSALDSDDYTRAEIAYADAEGRELNTATPGGHIATKEYDQDGNLVRELTAANRELALGTATNADAELVLLQSNGESTAVRAERLSTLHSYDSAGLALSETGPLHQVQLQHALSGGVDAAELDAGEQVPARKHTTYTYDEDRPSDAVASGLVTTTTVGVQVAGYPRDGDVTVTTDAYDWATGNRTKETIDPSGLALATTTSYTSDGLVNATTAPGGTTATNTYWTGSGTGTCTGHPEWTGLVCQTTTGTSASAAVTRQTTYDRWGNPAKVVETSGSTTRTTTHTYDAAGRLTLTHVASGIGTDLADRSVTYDTATGLTASVTREGASTTYTYDGLGRLTKYLDGAGNTTITAYDSADRPTSVTDSAPGTTTYSYSTTSTGDDVITMTDSAAGTFTFTYGAEGRLESQTEPSGNILKVTYNELGLVNQRLYTDSDDTPELLSATAYTIGNTIAHEARTAGTTVDVDYTYDQAGRLTDVDTNDAETTCTTRAYALDSAGNRTGVTTASATCADDSTATTRTETYTYDPLNRLSTTGYGYDGFGAQATLANGTALAYRTDGTPYRVTLGTDRETWTPDAEGRLATAATQSSSSGSWVTTATVVSHYADGTAASPSWSTDGTTTTRYLKDPQGNLVATVEGSAVTLTLTDVHGDTAVTLSLADNSAAVHDYTDTGVTDSTLRYGWLGMTARADRQLTGVLLIVGRLYTPALGRYLTPAPARGDEEIRNNAYLFASQDLT